MPEFRVDDDGAARRSDARLPEIDWSALPVGVERMRFSAPSGFLAGVRAGDPDGDRVMLIPGVTGSKEDFYLMFPTLVAAGYRVESFDLAGQYESWEAGPEPGAPYDWDLFEGDLEAVLDQGGPAHVLGYSFGGLVAECVARRRPELFRSLALLSVPPDSGNGFRRMKVIGPVTGVAPARVGAALMIWGVRWNLNRATRQRWRFARSRFAFTVRRSVVDVIGLMKEIPDVDASIRGLAIPKLVTAGSHDLWPLDAHREHADAVGADWSFYESGHSPCEDAPHELCRDLLALFSRG